MSRRRRDGRRGAEVFGTSLADILTTALGCVLLLFLVAVMHIRTSLTDARDSLVAEAEARARAESARIAALDRKRIAEAAARRASGAASEASVALAALQADRDRLLAERDGLIADKEALTAALATSEQRAQQASGRAAALDQSVRAVLGELDPLTARPVDVMLVIDGTASMAAGLDATRRNLRATVDTLRVVSPTARVGAIVFRDRREAPGMRLEQHPLTADAAELADFLAGIEATSTGVDDDRPEWLCGGLGAAEKARWRPGAIKLILTTSDAAADDPGAGPCLDTARRFAAAGGRIYMLSTPPPGYGRRRGITREHDRLVRPQHRAIAAAGNGAHVDAEQADGLSAEVLRAAFRARTVDPLQQLRNAVDRAEPPPAAPAEPPAAPGDPSTAPEDAPPATPDAPPALDPIPAQPEAAPYDEDAP